MIFWFLNHPPPVALPGANGLLAANWFWRAIECGIVTLVLLLPVGVAFTQLFPVLPMDRIGLAFFNMISGAAVTLVVCPIAGLRALADQPHAVISKRM